MENDNEPERRFRLRGVDTMQLIRQMENFPAALPGAGHDVGGVDLSALFGANLGPMTMLLRIEQHRWIDGQNQAQHRALSGPGKDDF